MRRSVWGIHSRYSLIVFPLFLFFFAGEEEEKLAYVPDQGRECIPEGHKEEPFSAVGSLSDEWLSFHFYRVIHFRPIYFLVGLSKIIIFIS